MAAIADRDESTTEPPTDRPRDTWDQTRAMLQILRRHKVLATVAIVLGLVGSGIELLVPLQVRNLTDNITNGSFAASQIIPLVGLIAASIALAVVNAIIVLWVGERIEHTLRTETVSAALRLPFSRTPQFNDGDITERTTGDTARIRAAVISGPLEVPATVVSFGGALAIMCYLDWQLTVTVLLAVLISVAVVAVLATVISRYTAEEQKARSQFAQDLLARLRAMPVIHAFRNRDKEADDMVVSSEQLRSRAMKVGKAQVILSPLIMIAVQVCLLVILLMGGYRAQAGSLDAGDLVAFIMYLMNASIPIMMGANIVSTMAAAIVSMRRVREMTSAAEEPESARQHIGETVSVTATDVVFHVDDDRTLGPISAAAKPGHMVALMGETGSGKTVFLESVMGLTNPDSGDIILSGSTGHSDASGTGNAVGWADQDNVMLPGSIADNVTYGSNFTADDTRTQEVMTALGLPTEWLTDDSVSSADLSGGERQRVCLARALLADSPLLVLDEPTSHVDNATESRIIDLLSQEATSGRTILLATHSAKLAAASDDIIRLDADGAATPTAPQG